MTRVYILFELGSLNRLGCISLKGSIWLITKFSVLVSNFNNNQIILQYNGLITLLSQQNRIIKMDKDSTSRNERKNSTRIQVHKLLWKV